MAETVKIALPLGVWTQVANGHANVSIQLAEAGQARLFAGTVAPAPDTENYVTLRYGGGANLGDLSVATGLWLMPDVTANAARILRS